MSELLKRLEKTETKVLTNIARLKRQIEAGLIAGEEDRKWLSQFCIGRGLDICCGDFPVVDEAIGVDIDFNKIGASYHVNGDELTFASTEEYDYIVTNYFDCFPNPLKVLQEWHRVLKPGGRLAFIVCDCQRYDNLAGPLANKHRLSAFTDVSLVAYLERAGYTDIKIRGHEKMLRVEARK